MRLFLLWTSLFLVGVNAAMYAVTNINPPLNRFFVSFKPTETAGIVQITMSSTLHGWVAMNLFTKGPHIDGECYMGSAANGAYDLIVGSSKDDKLGCVAVSPQPINVVLINGIDNANGTTIVFTRPIAAVAGLKPLANSMTVAWATDDTDNYRAPHARELRGYLQPVDFLGGTGPIVAITNINPYANRFFVNVAPTRSPAIVQITLTSREYGWLSWGLSLKSAHNEMDCYTACVKDGVPVFIVGSSTTTGPCIPLVPQPSAVKLISGEETPSGTKIVFNRPIIAPVGSGLKTLTDGMISYMASSASDDLAVGHTEGTAIGMRGPMEKVDYVGAGLLPIDPVMNSTNITPPKNRMSIKYVPGPLPGMVTITMNSVETGWLAMGIGAKGHVGMDCYIGAIASGLATFSLGTSNTQGACIPLSSQTPAGFYFESGRQYAGGSEIVFQRTINAPAPELKKLANNMIIWWAFSDSDSYTDAHSPINRGEMEILDFLGTGTGPITPITYTPPPRPISLQVSNVNAPLNRFYVNTASAGPGLVRITMTSTQGGWLSIGFFDVFPHKGMDCYSGCVQGGVPKFSVGKSSNTSACIPVVPQPANVQVTASIETPQGTTITFTRPTASPAPGLMPLTNYMSTAWASSISDELLVAHSAGEQTGMRGIMGPLDFISSTTSTLTAPPDTTRPSTGTLSPTITVTNVGTNVPSDGSTSYSNTNAPLNRFTVKTLLNATAGTVTISINSNSVNGTGWLSLALGSSPHIGMECYSGCVIGGVPQFTVGKSNNLSFCVPLNPQPANVVLLSGSETATGTTITFSRPTAAVNTLQALTTAVSAFWSFSRSDDLKISHDEGGGKGSLPTINFLVAPIPPPKSPTPTSAIQPATGTGGTGIVSTTTGTTTVNGTNSGGTRPSGPVVEVTNSNSPYGRFFLKSEAITPQLLKITMSSIQSGWVAFGVGDMPHGDMECYTGWVQGIEAKLEVGTSRALGACTPLVPQPPEDKVKVVSGSELNGATTVVFVRSSGPVAPGMRPLKDGMAVYWASAASDITASTHSEGPTGNRGLMAKLDFINGMGNQMEILDGSPESLSTPMMIGIIVGGFLVLLIVVGLIFCCLLKRHRKNANAKSLKRMSKAYGVADLPKGSLAELSLAPSETDPTAAMSKKNMSMSNMGGISSPPVNNFNPNLNNRYGTYQ